MLKLDHVVFPTTDPAASLAFYEDVLGLPLAQAITGDDWGGRSWLMLAFALAEGRELVLTAFRGAAPRNAVSTSSRPSASAKASISQGRPPQSSPVIACASGSPSTPS